MKKTLRTSLILITFFTALFTVNAHAAGGYETIKNAPARVDTERDEVLEYFWFGCPHCYAFEPTINAWAANKPDHVDFVREAPPLNPSWTAHSKAFYAAQLMGVTDEFFEPLFNAIHKDKKRLNTPKSISKFAATLGIDGDKFLKTMNSFAVDAKIRRSLDLARAAGINSVPSVVINGKYKTTGSIAGSNQRVIEVIEELTQR